MFSGDTWYKKPLMGACLVGVGIIGGWPSWFVTAALSAGAWQYHFGSQSD